MQFLVHSMKFLTHVDRFVAFVCANFSTPPPGKDKQDLLAAELQRQWQQRSLDLIKSLLERLEPVDGVVLMGGCALNVAANQFIQDSLKMEADQFLKHVLLLSMPLIILGGGLSFF